MKLIKPSYEILESEGYLKDIELAGRICYKSEDKITTNSKKEFVERMIKSGHLAMLEHGTIYLIVAKSIAELHLINFYKRNKYSIVKENDEHLYITTNYRVIIENDRMEDLKYRSFPFDIHEKRIAVKFVLDKGISHELMRHRTFSFAQESTRYCNYSNDKFDNELTFIIPCWLNLKEGRYSGNSIKSGSYVWINNMCNQEEIYVWLLSSGWTPQQARSVLPNSLKTEIIMTGFSSDWEHFFELRDDKVHVHPQMYEVVHPLHEEFITKNLL
jgi:thymidylate synthase (FAD)